MTPQDVTSDLAPLGITVINTQVTNTKILIVEDEQLVAADLEAKLHVMGYKVVGCAASGLEAIRIAELHRPDLVLMDIRLQGEMDGIEAAKCVQARTQAKVIFVSAFGQLSKFAGGTLSQDRCLTKPFSKSQLQAVVSSALGENLR